MNHRRLQRFAALCAVFAMLFDSIPVSTVADEAGGAAPVCGMEEHRHTDGCYQDDELICGKKEHTHTDACYPAPEPEPAAEPEHEPEEEQNSSLADQPAEEQAAATPEITETDPAEESEPEETETPAQQEETEESGEPAEPAEPETPADPQEPTETEAPDEPAEPEEQDEPAEPADPAEPEEPAPTEPEKPEPVQEEPEAPAHFESGYVLIKSKTIAYTDVYRTAEEGTFIGYATAWAVSALKSEDPEKDWLQITFDTEEARTAGSELLTGYIQAASVRALTEEESKQLAAQLEADPAVRKTGTHPLPVVSFELKEKPEEEPRQEPASEPAEEQIQQPPEAPDEETEDTLPEETPETGEPADELPEEPDDELTREAGEEPEGEQAEEGTEEPGEEPEEEPAPEPTEVTLSTDDAPYKVVLSFSSDAGIPEGAELVVTEADAESGMRGAEDAAPQRNAKRSAAKLASNRGPGIAAEEARVNVPSLVSWSESEAEPEILLYRKTLDISLVVDGAEIEPEKGTRVTVSVMLPGIEAGQDVEVSHLTKDGPVTLESTNDAGTVTFVTDSFSLFTFTSRAQQVSSERTNLAENIFYGKTADRNLHADSVPLTEVTEGLEVLEAYTLPQDADAWMALRPTGIPETEGAESIVLYAVDGNRLSGIVQDNVVSSRSLRFNLGELNGYALVKDTGYRHLEQVLEHVVLDGMMPKAAVATATDVKEAYSTEDIPGEEILAAYDISILDGGTKVQPEKGPITVTIRDEGIARTLEEGRELKVRHIRDDGTEEEITDFRVEGDAVIFEATSFSVYTVIDHEDGDVVTPRVMFHFIADKAAAATDETSSTAYYHGDPYSFTNVQGGTQTTQILKDGESLELIKDPDNETQRYFFGWYIVEPYIISGTTDKYGIGTNGQLYYTWTSVPKSIPFESPITIDESNIQIGDTVHWSLNGVSGSGEVDSDGNAHVFIAPVFEHYNFVNFMLYPYAENTGNSIGTNNVMTRKLIPLGSSPQTDVKISDIRASSTDPVHLIFTGWQYNAGTETDPVWRDYQTVSYSGEELTDDGRDGVYLNVDLDDKSYIDLYPVFIEARWVDYFSGGSDSGATYVASCFRESWGVPGNEPEGMTPDPGKNVFTTMNTSTREGYDFDGWYAFAVRDRRTGKILNLDEAMDVTVSYIDLNHKYTTIDATVHTKAVKITNADGSIALNGNCCLIPDGDTYTIGNSGPITLFGAAGGQLKLYDALDRLSLTANWAPASSQITIIYWTENVQESGYTAPAAEKDDYTASAVKVIQTSDLNGQSAVIGETFSSGSTITLAQLALYQEGSVSVLDQAYLDDAGAVLEGEEKFYERNDALSDSQVVIKGDGSTTINVYYSRMTFKLVFHIGRDGYVKSNGQQKPEFMTRPEYANWDGNWIQFMFNDEKISNSPDDPNNPGLGYTPGPTAGSYGGVFSMTYNEVTYTSEYDTSPAKVKGNYVPGDDENVYVITAKYGAYIGDRWPTPVNSAFTFADPSGAKKTMYIWAAYYGSLYCRIANERSNTGNTSGNNPDINGIYEYMSAELCSNRAGTDVINDNHVHHLVAWFGDKGKAGVNKHYHIYYAAIPGTYDPAEYPETEPGSDYLTYSKTTWCTADGQPDAMSQYSFYKVKDAEVISNLEPQFQLGSDLEGYELVYSCYITPYTNEHHIYFFYVPKQYTLTFNLGNTTEADTYYYTQTLAEADKYTDEVTIPEGYYFKGWYTNTAGVGDPFDFANETMPNQNLVLYPVVQVLQYTVRIDPNGGVVDHRVNESQSTYFTADYGTPVGEYSTNRGYIKLTDKELDSQDAAHYYTGTKYYYINTQLLGIPSEGDWGLPNELRNAAYVAEDQIDAYYNWYCEIIDNRDTSWWTGIQKLERQEFIDTYTSQWYRPLAGAEHYTFMGWYQVYSDGSVSSMPYNFNTPTTGPLELCALWRLDGGYYIQYVPTYYVDAGDGNVTAIVGNMPHWTDPDITTSQPYADQAPTNILQAPTLPEGMTEQWIFRGWRVVRPNGERPYTYQNDSGETISGTYPVWEPMQLTDPGESTSEPVYYQPGDHFTIDSDYVTAQGDFGGIIYMQAFYEPADNSRRRPYITNLTLDANETYGHGYVNTIDSSGLPELNDGATSRIKTEDNLDAHGDPKQILFGDVQSNLALHLNQYATTTGRQYFESHDGYLLIGFDEKADPMNPTTGSPYIPMFYPDSVVAVTRNDDRTLYAMWEPMVYVNFVNQTGGPITINLNGSGNTTISIVNEATGKFDRQKVETDITLEAGERVKVVLPRAVVGTDSITAIVTNDHFRRKMSVSGEYPEGTTPYGDGSSEITCGSDVIYTGTLVTDPDGVVVTYTEEPDAQVLYDVNGGTWEDDEPYQHVSGDIYALDIKDIGENGYEPADPIHNEMIFIGWTEYPEIAAIHDFSSDTIPLTVNGNEVVIPSGSIQLDVVRDNYLWDFSRDASELYENDKTLYAVWSEAVTVTFDIVRTGSNLHTWNGPAVTNVKGPYVYYQSSTAPSSITYTLAKGEKVPKPDDPTTNQSGWYFVQWLLNDTSRRNTTKNPSDPTIISHTYDFSQRIMDNNTTLSTSWTTTEPQIFTFTVENRVNGNPNEEFTYTIAVSNEKVFGKIGTNTKNAYGDPDQKWGSVTTTLKNNETYTVQIKVLCSTKWTPNTYSIEIDVLDREGNVIKSGHVVYCNNNSVSSDYAGKNFTSDYKYMLTITQDEKTGYETTVGVEGRNNVDSPWDYTADPPAACEETSDSERKYIFTSIHCGTTAQSSNFTPLTNEYTGGESNSLTVVFTNTGSIIAPTAFRNVTGPFALMMLTGLLLLTGLVVPVYIRKRRRGKSEIQEAVHGYNPGTMPPCPRAYLWNQPKRPPGKRGGSG